MFSRVVCFALASTVALTGLLVDAPRAAEEPKVKKLFVPLGSGTYLQASSKKLVKTVTNFGKQGLAGKPDPDSAVIVRFKRDAVDDEHRLTMYNLDAEIIRVMIQPEDPRSVVWR